MGMPAAIFVTITGAIAMSQFMRAALSVVAPDVVAEIGLSAESYGTMASAFFLGVAAGQIPTGVMFDRFGPRATMTGMQLLAAAGTVLFALSDGFWGLSVGRFVTGFGFASALMGGFVLASRWFAPERFGQIAGLFVACSGAVGLLLAATPMAALAGAVGWRGGFLVFAGLTALSGLGVWAVVRDAPPDHPWHARPPESLAETFRGFGTILRLPGLGYVILMAMVGYPTMLTLLGVWGGPYLNDVHGLGGVARGNVLSAMVVGGVAGLLAYGRLDRLLDTRKHLVVAGALGGAAVLAALAALERPPLWLVTGLLALYGMVGSYYVVNITLGRATYPENMIGRGVTTVNLGTFVGVAVLQVATGLLMGAFGAAGPTDPAPETAYRWLFAVLAAYAAVIVLFYTRVRDIPPSAEHRRAVH